MLCLNCLHIFVLLANSFYLRLHGNLLSHTRHFAKYFRHFIEFSSKSMREILKSPAYENCNGPMIQHYCHGVTVSTHPIAARIKKGSNNVWMCRDGNSMAIMLDHRSTALGRDFNSQVLKHRKCWITLD